MKIGVVSFGSQAVLTTVDTTALIGQTMVSPVKQIDYAPRSAFYQNLASTTTPGADLATTAKGTGKAMIARVYGPSTTP